MDTTSNGPELTSWEPGDDRDDLTWTHPATLAVASLALAILSLMGAAVFRGALYTLIWAPESQGLGQGGDTPGFMVAGGFLTAAFALLPLWLARRGLASWVPADGPWPAHLLRAAVLLGGLSLVLHLLGTVASLAAEGPYSGFFSYVSG
jgi:hypothetical protein